MPKPSKGALTLLAAGAAAGAVVLWLSGDALANGAKTHSHGLSHSDGRGNSDHRNSRSDKDRGEGRAEENPGRHEQAHRERERTREHHRDRDEKPAPNPSPSPSPASNGGDHGGGAGGGSPSGGSPPSAPSVAPAPGAPASSSNSGGGGGGAAGGGHSGAPRVTLPPPGETRFIKDQIVVTSSGDLTPQAMAEILKRHELTELEAIRFDLTGLTLHLLHIPGGRDVAEVERDLATENGLGAVQPNFVFTPAEDASTPAIPGLYALEKLRVDPALDLGGAIRVKVALIDTAIDEKHPDLVGAVFESYDAIGAGAAHNFDHGTAMAGAIVGHGQVRGVAPSVQLLSARAFDSDGKGGALGNSATIMKAIDWSVREGAVIVNMSFAGPHDPALSAVLAAAAKRGVALIGAVGNAGPKSPPLYPGADENVIAITATDSQDKPYDMANVGAYVAAAAPGVDVLLPAPEGAYSLETGTSVSTALASGVVALALERRPNANAAQIRGWLGAGARRFGSEKEQVGAGLIDAGEVARAAAR